MEENEMIDYTKASKTYDNTRNSDDMVIEIMCKKGTFGKNKNILDYGCGTGNYLHKISQKYECNCYGLEPSFGMRQEAIKKNPGLVILEGNHENIPFEDSFFDFIYMTDVIHHVPDINLLFKNINNKLRQNASVCILTESWEQIENRWYNQYFPSLANNEKKRYPDIDKIVQSALQNGFQLETIDLKQNPEKNIIDKRFIQMVEEKNYSMFRILEEREYEIGLLTRQQSFRHLRHRKWPGQENNSLSVSV
jgi:ubiquinone/menaquinone biosynthesis C-methylase UbiE